MYHILLSEANVARPLAIAPVLLNILCAPQLQSLGGSAGCEGVHWGRHNGVLDYNGPPQKSPLPCTACL